MSDLVGQEPIYNSVYRHGVDLKRRIQVPAKWRVTDQEVDFTLIRWKNDDQPHPCILVLPPTTSKILMETFKSMPFANPEAERLRRSLGRKANQAVMDQGGRICIPEDMAKAVGIKDEVVMAGLWDRFELWNPEYYDEVSAADEASEPKAMKLIS